MRFDGLIWPAALLATQLVAVLYGAGIRRPFGSLKTISTAPGWLRSADALVLAADAAFVVFLLLSWIAIYPSLGLLWFLILFIVGWLIGAFFEARIRLGPSLWISIVLASSVLFWISQHSIILQKFS
jgi:hypothetical protein